MQKNVGGLDRTLRLVVGPLLVVVGIVGYAGFLPLAFLGIGQALAAVVLFLIGAILLVTGTVQKCPLNSLFGVDTYRGGSGKDPSDASTDRPT